uniref:LZ_Tnp_IS66 domain-containing protein n=1 Tax=Meloidogyne hapla TaxID=6305 RepID=A0A1I8BT68_MELHA
MSGAASTLKRLLNQLENIKKEVETKILPAIERLEEIDRRFTRLSNWHNKKQRDELESRGYTFLSKEQSKMMLTGREDGQSKLLQEINEDELGDDESEIDAILEEDIRKISKINENDHNLYTKVGDEFKKYLPNNKRSNRTKRFMEIETLGQMRILDPFLFVNQVNDGKVMRRVALSPRAFSLQLLTPDFGGVSK